VAGDACWDLPKEVQDLMTNEQKETHCDCMGVNALRQESCNFPGLGEFYVDAIDEADPIEPEEPGPEPEQPEFPPEPVRPENPGDGAALQAYLDELAAYNDEVSSLRQDFENELAEWRAEQQLYQAQLVRYQTELAELEVDRATAIGSAETSIRRFNDDYGWTFVDQDNQEAYYRRMLSTWAAQLIIISVLFVGTIVMQKRRDVT
jgi:hypothetical protein